MGLPGHLTAQSTVRLTLWRALWFLRGKRWWKALREFYCLKKNCSVSARKTWTLPPIQSSKVLTENKIKKKRKKSKILLIFSNENTDILLKILFPFRNHWVLFQKELEIPNNKIPGLECYFKFSQCFFCLFLFVGFILVGWLGFFPLRLSGGKDGKREQ